MIRKRFAQTIERFKEAHKRYKRIRLRYLLLIVLCQSGVGAYKMADGQVRYYEQQRIESVNESQEKELLEELERDYYEVSCIAAPFVDEKCESEYISSEEILTCRENQEE